MRSESMAIGLWLMLALPVLAQSGIEAQIGVDAAGRLTITGDEARLIAQVAQNVGDTEFSEDVIGTPSLTIHREDGREWFKGDFIGCTQGKECQALVLSADFGNLGLSNDQLNNFNGEYFYVRAYTNGVNSVVLQQDISLIYGVNDEWLRQSIGTFGRMVDVFEDWSAKASVDAMIKRLTVKD